MSTSASRLGGSRGITSGPVLYRPKSYQLIPPRLAIDGQLAAKRNPNDRAMSETTHRTYRPQLAYYDMRVERRKQFPWQQQRDAFYRVETAIINKAFDTPELIPIFLRDEVVRGRRDAFAPQTIDTVKHWVQECRYWRAIGLSKPFYSEHQLRAFAWANHGNDLGRIQFSAAMSEAVKDLERALKRTNLGLDPNYVWDKWGPGGFVDGRRADYLPRFKYNAYMDPDGVDVTDEDVAGLVSHEQLKERYGSLIFGDTTPYQGAFLAPSNGIVELDDLPQPVIELYGRLRATSKAAPTQASQEDLRALLYIVAGVVPLSDAQGCQSWEALVALVAPARERLDLKVDAARLFHLPFRTVDDCRSLFEEKCAFPDFMRTPDKVITAAVLCLLDDIKRVVDGNGDWGVQLSGAVTDLQRREAIGDDAFKVWQALEGLILDRRRRLWMSRFVGDVHEEKALDHMLSNFARRTERPEADSSNATGMEFDREQEPIGRKVQRRVLESDKAGASKGPKLSFRERMAQKEEGNSETNPLYALQHAQFANMRAR